MRRRYSILFLGNFLRELRHVRRYADFGTRDRLTINGITFDIVILLYGLIMMW